MDVQEVNIPQVWLDLLINSVKWSERRGEIGVNPTGKKSLKVFPVICVTCRKKQNLFVNSVLSFLCFPLPKDNSSRLHFIAISILSPVFVQSLRRDLGATLGQGEHSPSEHHFWAVMTNASWHGQLHQAQPHHLSNAEVIRAWDCVRALIWKPKQL